MRSMTLLWAVIFIFSTGCGGVVKENSKEKAGKQPVSSESEDDFGEKDYPNPFSARAGINFTLEKPDSVKIEIFTIEGDTAGVIADRFFDEGDHFVPVDNIGLKAGIYLFEITTSDSVFAKKMTLIR